MFRVRRVPASLMDQISLVHPGLKCFSPVSWVVRSGRLSLAVQAGETQKVQTHHHTHPPEGCGATGWISPQIRRGPEGPDAFLNTETVCHTPQMRRGWERSRMSGHIHEHRDAFHQRISELSVGRHWSSTSSRMFRFILLPSLVRLETSNFAVPSHSLRRFRFTLVSLCLSSASQPRRSRTLPGWSRHWKVRSCPPTLNHRLSTRSVSKRSQASL